MTKWFGKIGFGLSVNNGSGNWRSKMSEREYYGDVVRNSRKWINGNEKVSEDLQLSNEISVLADDFAFKNFQAIKYVEFYGSLWKVTRELFLS